MTFIWLRTSMRILDNALWTEAGALSQPPDQITVILTPALEQYRRHGYGDRRCQARHEQTEALSQHLQQQGLRVLLLTEDTYQAVAEALLALAENRSIETLWADREYGLNERRRDSWLGKRLNALSVNLNLVNDRLTYPPEQVLTRQGQPYRVFTAYKNAWRASWAHDPRAPYPRPEWAHTLPAPEESAQMRLAEYTAADLDNYEEARNDLAVPVVSGLSPAIANGLLTTRQAFASVADPEHPAARKWLDEWIWREFFYVIGVHFPALYQHRPLQEWTDAVSWSDRQDHLSAWQEGRTGFPIIDAAMRQLKATGQMPNRARMFTCAFLAKDLLLDWRLGEAWFLEQLSDADFAVNNGNWQWGSSVGVDAAPYFRIFNPLRQAERFDPSGDYVRQWIPELAHLPAPSIHDPAPLERAETGYPEPLVIHKEAAERTKSIFSQAKTTTAVKP